MQLKKKTYTTAIIALLTLSIVLVATSIQPASSAGGKVVTCYPTLVETGTSTADWETTTVQGTYAVKLYTTYLTDDYAGVEFILTGELTIADLDGITDTSFKYNMPSGAYRGPLLELRFISADCIDPDGAGHVDITVDTAELIFTADGTWQTESVTGASHAIFFGNNPDGTAFSGGALLSAIADAIALASDYTVTQLDLWELVRVHVDLGWCGGYLITNKSTAYIDDIVITNATSGDVLNEDFEPSITLDYAWYKMDDVVKATVFDIGLNTRSTIKDSGTFIAASNYPDQIRVDLLETGFDTAIFEGTFTVVEKNPGANDLLVKHGNTITASYTHDSTVISDTAIVDAKAPSVTDLTPEKNANVSKTYGFIVSAAVSDVGASGIDVAWLTLDGVVRATSLPLSYTVPKVSPLAEGVHTVVVTASDVAGNVNITCWTFTVDTTESICIISMNVTSPVNATAIEFTFEFNEDMRSLPLPTIAGNATTYMTGPVKGWKDVRTYSANYTVKSIPLFNGTVLLTVEDVLDIAGNEMIPANFTFYIDNIAPTAPENLTATALVNSIVLDWDASEDLGSGVERYNIIRNGTKVGTVNHPILNFTDTTIVKSGIYFYQVKAYDFAGTPSILSKEANATLILGAVTWYNISLSKGWNLISLPLIPENASIEAVLSEVIENVTNVWAYDAETGTWLMYNPAIPEISDLTKMEDGVGYWINMTSAATLMIEGSEFPEPPATPPVYHVVVGWNLIGYKEIVSMNASQYLAGVEYVRLWTFADGMWSRVTPADQMVPGRGYWIAVSEEGWIYP